jgi:hypothetical protein
MFYLHYIFAELRRRKGRTVLTSLGLGVGVGLVVAVTALSAGLDEAQSEVLEPLTGVGTDMSVSRSAPVARRSSSTIRRPRPAPRFWPWCCRSWRSPCRSPRRRTPQAARSGPHPGSGGISEARQIEAALS